MDEHLYEFSLETDNKINPVVDKEVLYVTDQNSGSYNGQIQIDTSVLSNSGKWLAFKEGYLQIPFLMKAQGSVDMTATFNGFICGLKNGHHQLIDSIQVDYNNTNVVQLQPFTNFYVSYKLMTSLSEDDVKKHGSTIGFIPDSAGSYTYSTAAAVDGNGLCNNRVMVQNVRNTSTSYRTLIEEFNENYAERLRLTSFEAEERKLPTVNTSARARNIGKNLFSNDGNAVAADTIYYWSILATIRLKDVADFFDKMPLVKGGFMRMIINYNSSSFVVTSTGAVGAAHTLTSAAPTFKSGRTVNVMMSSAAPKNPTDVAQGTVTVETAVGSLSGVPSPSINSVRLYVPAYQLNPVYESQLLELKPEKEIVYTDIYNYNFVSNAAGSSFNQILTNGIVNPKKVIVIPFVSASGNGGLGVSPYQSPFDSSPGTSSPCAAISQFNIQVGGRNIFQQNFQYDFETFVNEVSQANAINGGATVGLSNGLLGHYEWDNAYRYYVADISRRLPSEDKVPKSVVVMGTNESAATMDYVCFIEYERKIRIDMVSGALLN